ncbi:PREDICTED: uncharacterized protein LOC108968644 [Bactrocera latifrons]|uniref:uncharacterized protein LOC108968644 n=1 Tax=Bactrocera latifrons TaxID=174628 RepID=UPI0008DCEBB2|nr:PREDICTED: uncharacterized protein LOC108968644 [Bactrocera latifrons]
MYNRTSTKIIEVDTYIIWILAVSFSRFSEMLLTAKIQSGRSTITLTTAAGITKYTTTITPNIVGVFVIAIIAKTLSQKRGYSPTHFVAAVLLNAYITVAVLQKQHNNRVSSSTTTSYAALAASENLLLYALTVLNATEKIKS